MEGGRPFAAHEVLEARWKAGPPEERGLWQGLAQVCVAITHAARGNQTGAERLLERATTNLAAYAATGRDNHGLDMDAVLGAARKQMAEPRAHEARLTLQAQGAIDDSGARDGARPPDVG